MKLVKLLSAEQIILDLKSLEHWATIVELVEQLVTACRLSAELKDEILADLRLREDQVSTGVGSGVAIPHTFSDHIDEVIAVLGRSKDGIEFQALDNAPVHLVILFIVPRKDYHLHLQTLAAIAKMITNCDIRRQISEASTPDEILAILDCKPRPAGLRV